MQINCLELLIICKSIRSRLSVFDKNNLKYLQMELPMTIKPDISSEILEIFRENDASTMVSVPSKNLASLFSLFNHFTLTSSTYILPI